MDDQFLNKLVNNTSHYLLNKIDIEKKKSNKKTLHRYGTQGPPPEALIRFLVSCICNSHYIFMELREELFGILLCTWIYLYTASWACFAGSLWSVTDRESGSTLHPCWSTFTILCTYINIFIYLLCMIFGDKWFFKRLACIWFCTFPNYGTYLSTYLLDIKRCNWLSKINPQSAKCSKYTAKRNTFTVSFLIMTFIQ